MFFGLGIILELENQFNTILQFSMISSANFMPFMWPFEWELHWSPRSMQINQNWPLISQISGPSKTMFLIEE